MSVNLKSIKKQLMDKYPFFGSIIDGMEYFETPNCVSNGVPTAGTDGKTIFYHPDIDKLPEKQQLFLFAHEICHIAFNHKKRGEGKDHKIWNIATDAVINANLKKDSLEPIKGSVNIPWAIKFDAEEVYEKLLKKNKNNDKNNSSDNEFNNGGHDDHDLWYEDSLNNEDSPLDDIVEKFASMGEKEVLEDKDKEKVKKILEEIKKTLQKLKKIKGNKKASGVGIGKTAGTSTNEEKIVFDNVGIQYPLVNWPLILKRPTEIVELDWSYRNADIEDGVLISNLEESSYLLTHQTEIVLDTSGSIDDELLRSFLRECKNIFNFSKIKVGCFDTKFYGFTEIRTIADIDRLQFVGRGGTDFNAAVNAFSPNADNKIIFTDGEASMPMKKVDAVWIVFGDNKICPSGGKVIYIDKKLLDERSENSQLQNINDGQVKVLSRTIKR